MALSLVANNAKLRWVVLCVGTKFLIDMSPIPESQQKRLGS